MGNQLGNATRGVSDAICKEQPGFLRSHAFILEDPAVWFRNAFSMKIKIITTAFAASLMFILPASADDTALAEQMDIMNDAYKTIRRAKTPEGGAPLARDAQNAMIKAITEIPELVKEMPDGPEKEKAVAEYRKQMGMLIATLAELELAFLNEDMEQVDAVIDKMRDSKKEAHKKFMKEE